MKQRTYARRARRVAAAALTAALTWAVASPATAQSRPQQRSTTQRGTYRRAAYNNARTVALEAGTVIPVRLDKELNSKDDRQGDTFTATVRAEDGADYSGVPAGSTVEGRVLTARPRKDKEPGILELGFRRLRLPDGRSVAITGSLIGLDNGSVETRDGRLVAKPGQRNNRLTYAGYGAAGGAVIGLLTGGKLRLENALLGGALGYLFGTTEKGKAEARDVSLKPGTEMGVRLDRRLTFNSYGGDEDYGDARSSERIRRDRDPDTAEEPWDRPRGERVGSRRDDGRATSADARVLVNGRSVRFSATARPVERDGVVLVPASPVMDAAGVEYAYDSGKREVRASGREGTVRMSIDSRVATVGSERVRLDAPARRLNGTVYVPLRFVELATGLHASWDADRRTVTFGEERDDLDR